MNKQDKKLIIFDYDGVIVDSIDVVKDIYNEICKKYNFPPAKSKQDIANLFDKNFFESLKQFNFSPLKIKSFLNEAKELLIKKQHKIKLFDGIAKMLKKLSTNKNILIIISSNHSETIKSLLKKYQLDEYFDLIVGAEKEKSKIKKINSIVKQFDFKKENTYYIGDTMGDILEGQKARVKTVAITWGYQNTKKLATTNPNFICNKTSDLAKLFK